MANGAAAGAGPPMPELDTAYRATPGVRSRRSAVAVAPAEPVASIDVQRERSRWDPRRRSRRPLAARQRWSQARTADTSSTHTATAPAALALPLALPRTFFTHPIASRAASTVAAPLHPLLEILDRVAPPTADDHEHAMPRLARWVTTLALTYVGASVIALAAGTVFWPR